MKKSILLLTLFMLVAAISIAQAGVVRNNAGCGLGSMIFGDKDGLLFEILATTTNGTFGNQTFGMTSGTLGCAPFKGIVSNEKINLYVADNMDNLAKDIAKGNGEYLETLALLMNVPDSEKQQFFSKLQANFNKIYTSSDVTSTDVVKNIEVVLQNS
ncbi:MAG: DUF3015 domain-containing protein [Spirochaetota bacterium]